MIPLRILTGAEGGDIRTESYCWLALTSEPSVPAIVLSGFKLCSCQVVDLVFKPDRKVPVGQLEPIRQLSRSLFGQGPPRACGPGFPSLHALSGRAPATHVLSIIHDMMSLIGDDETLQRA